MKKFIKQKKKTIKINGEYIGESSGSFACSGSITPNGMTNSDYADIRQMLDPNAEIIKDNYYNMDYLNETP